MANTLAYYDMATITAVKKFIVQVPALIWVGSRPTTVQHTHPSKFFKLSIIMHRLVNFQGTKMAHAILESI